jgi:fatty-acyl-CoA synthase
MSALETAPVVAESASRAWLRALERTASIARNPTRVLSVVMEEMAERRGDAPALMSDDGSLTYRSLVQLANQYARWAQAIGIRKGDSVGLLMNNRPEYFAIWLGISSIGGVVALLNTHLVRQSLAHCITVAQPKHLIVAQELTDSLGAALSEVSNAPEVWVHGADHPEFCRIEEEIRKYSAENLSAGERPDLTVRDRALYIYTSGTTGWPKAANISHARILQWTHWFAGMMGVQPEDRMYNCLPMYHSIGGVLVPGAMLVAGGSVVTRERFSASQFWNDIVRWDCTMFQYIGEFCRYLVHAGRSAKVPSHRVRLACGNGLAPDVWREFKEQSGVPRIFEFYASTEGGVSLFNVEGVPGSIGRVPPYLAHRFSPALVRFDVVSGEPIRNEEGLCIACSANEPGEALGPILEDAANIGSRWEGYTDAEASQKKILRSVFRSGDAWIRTGDLMRKDEKGFFYFVDRVGDTFRWKGENVATSEVAQAICTFPGVRHANVYGVKIAASEGRVGMAAVVAEHDLDLGALRTHLISHLPAYARPAFLRFCDGVEVTGTMKYSKTELVRLGFDPAATPDPIYFDHPESHSFLPLDQTLYQRIQIGEVRL